MSPSIHTLFIFVSRLIIRDITVTDYMGITVKKKKIVKKLVTLCKRLLKFFFMGVM